GMSVLIGKRLNNYKKGRPAKINCFIGNLFLFKCEFNYYPIKIEKISIHSVNLLNFLSKITVNSRNLVHVTKSDFKNI
ncbi:hypothetical protein BpHYR1_001125, partial [Brachionus plicatilis]